MKARVVNGGNLMQATATGDLGAGGASAAKQIRVDMTVGHQRVGYVVFTRITDASFLFELNVKGERRQLSYTIGEGHVSGSHD